MANKSVKVVIYSSVFVCITLRLSDFFISDSILVTSFFNLVLSLVRLVRTFSTSRMSFVNVSSKTIIPGIFNNSSPMEVNSEYNTSVLFKLTVGFTPFSFGLNHAVIFCLAET